MEITKLLTTNDQRGEARFAISRKHPVRQDFISNCLNDMDALLARSRMLVEVIKKHQWEGSLMDYFGDEHSCCVECGGLKEQIEEQHMLSNWFVGHSPDCKLNAIIKEEEVLHV